MKKIQNWNVPLAVRHDAHEDSVAVGRALTTGGATVTIKFINKVGLPELSGRATMDFYTDIQRGMGTDGSFYLEPLEESGNIASEAATIREERAAVYGKGHYNHGHVLAALFPAGLTLSTPEDFTRFTMFNNLLTKVVRYGLQFSAGGHRDSALDAGNYAHLLAELDDELSDNRR